jgi:hypothetical protein
MAETTEELALRLASQPALFTNFVDFTSTLIRGVFDTLVDVTREQLKTYVDMVTALRRPEPVPSSDAGQSRSGDA